MTTLIEFILNLEKIWETEGISGNEFRRKVLKFVHKVELTPEGKIKSGLTT